MGPRTRGEETRLWERGKAWVGACAGPPVGSNFADVMVLGGGVEVAWSLVPLVAGALALGVLYGVAPGWLAPRRVELETADGAEAGAEGGESSSPDTSPLLLGTSRRPRVRGARVEFGGVQLMGRGGREAVLHDTVGLVPAGSLCAVLGPSGAGKSSLLDVLAGRKGSAMRRGMVRFVTDEGDGEEGSDGGGSAEAGASTSWASTPEGERRRVARYVTQDCPLPAQLTMRQCLWVYGRLRCPRGTAAGAVAERVDWVLDVLGLRGVADGMLVGSGGKGGMEGTGGAESCINSSHKKALALGCELLFPPDILLVDEPTTGMDGADTRRVARALLEVTGTGCTVVAALHQPRPEVMKMVSHVLLLGIGGRTLFNGPPQEVPAFLAAHSLGYAQVKAEERAALADSLLDYALGLSGPALEAAAKRESERLGIPSPLTDAGGDKDWATPSVLGTVTEARASVLTQAKVLFLRCLCEGRNGVARLLTACLALGGIGLAAGIIFMAATKDTSGIQSRIGTLFFILILVGFTSLASLATFHDARMLLAHERASGLCSSSVSLLVSLCASILPQRILETLTLSLLFYPYGECESCDAGVFVRVLVMSSFAATGLSLLCAALFSERAPAVLGASLVHLGTVLFSGFTVSNTGGHLSGVFMTSYPYHALRALVTNEFCGQPGFTYVSLATRLSVPVEGCTVARDLDFLPHDTPEAQVRPDYLEAQSLHVALCGLAYYAVALVAAHYLVRERR